METLKQLFLPAFRFKKEHLAILTTLLLFLNFPWLSRHIDITAAAIDAGALSSIIMAILALLAFKAVTWWLIRNIWPALAVYAEYHFENNFKSLAPCQKVIIFLSFYLFLLFLFILTLGALV